ncbi:MAG: aminotransferase class I/II-fold pyridoxal phosphate-dependent enzyme, partial [Candidatus Viridilinea halotolerans]
KQGLDLSTSTTSQTVAYYACRDGLIERHAPRLRALYRERRDAMLAALKREMPPGVRWTHPQGGMFLWLTLPDGWNSTQLLDHAIELGVAFVPGEPFHPCGGGTNTMRLNFSYSSATQIAEGVRRLAAAIQGLAQ